MLRRGSGKCSYSLKKKRSLDTHTEAVYACATSLTSSQHWPRLLDCCYLEMMIKWFYIRAESIKVHIGWNYSMLDCQVCPDKTSNACRTLCVSNDGLDRANKELAFGFVCARRSEEGITNCLSLLWVTCLGACPVGMEELRTVFRIINVKSCSVVDLANQC